MSSNSNINTNTDKKSKRRNMFWGIFFIVATVLLIASQLGSFEQLSFWSVIGTIALAAIIIQSIISRMWVGIFVPISLLYLIYQQPLNLPYLAPWLIIIAAILLSIGFHILFKSKISNMFEMSSNGHEYCQDSSNAGTDANAEGGEYLPAYILKCGGTSRYLHSTNLAGAEFNVNFGGLEIFFDNATLNAGGADIVLNCKVGGITLYVPRNWPVKSNVSCSMGAVDFGKVVSQPDFSLPELRLSGNVSMGGIEVKYI